MIHLDLKKKFDLWVGGLGIALIYYPVRLVGLLLKRNHSLDKPKHLAVIKILGGGSLLMIYPVLVSFREKYPQAKITLICGRSIQSFAQMYKIFDHIHVIDDRSALGFLASGLQAFLILLKNIDVSLDLEIHSRITTLLTTMSLVKNRVGLIDNSSLWRKRIYTHGIFVSSSGSMSAAYDATAPLFGIHNLRLSAIREKFIQQITKENLPPSLGSSDSNKFKSFIAIGMGCSDLAFERQMNPRDWKQLLGLIKVQNPDVQFVFLGGPADRHLTQTILAQEPELSASSLDLCGEVSLDVSLKVLHQSALFIGIDSALIHLARTIGTPSVSFWGPTSPDSLLRDWPQQELRIFSRLHCSPCVHQTEVPPCGGKNVCMNHTSKFSEIVDFARKSLEQDKQKLTSVPSGVRTTWSFTPDNESTQALTYEVT